MTFFLQFQFSTVFRLHSVIIIMAAQVITGRLNVLNNSANKGKELN